MPKESIRPPLETMATAQGIMRRAMYVIPEVADVGESKWDVPLIGWTDCTTAERASRK